MREACADLAGNLDSYAPKERMDIFSDPLPLTERDYKNVIVLNFFLPILNMQVTAELKNGIHPYQAPFSLLKLSNVMSESAGS